MTFQSLLFAYSATGAAVVAESVETTVVTESTVVVTVAESVATTSAGAVFLPQDANDTATITAKNKTNFFIFV